MTDTDATINERLARFCGWDLCSDEYWCPPEPEGGYPSEEDDDHDGKIADYFNDGNAMCDLLQALKDKGGIEINISTALQYPWQACVEHWGIGFCDNQHDNDCFKRAVALAANEVILAIEKTPQVIATSEAPGTQPWPEKFNQDDVKITIERVSPPPADKHMDEDR